jgi:hypothetical protein
MGDWTSAELETLGRVEEIGISSLRPDGSARPFVTIWIVRLGEALYVRSGFGPECGWYRRARASGLGRIQAPGDERDVAFEAAGEDIADALHRAYHAKYDRYGPDIVGPVVSAESARCTLRVTPR